MIDQDTGKTTFFAKHAIGDDGIAMAYNHSDGNIYNLTGTTFDRINLDTKESQEIDLSGAGVAHVRALTFTAEGDFLAVDTQQPMGNGGRLLSITPEGVVKVLGNMGHASKGLAFLPPVAAAGVASDFDGDRQSDILWHHVDLV